MRALALTLALAACHHEAPPSKDKPAASCLVEHDGGTTQCFDEIGVGARTEGPSLCSRMHGEHSYRVGQPCPGEGVIASCRKGAGTSIERVERCYRDRPACEARCEKSGGVLEW